MQARTREKKNKAIPVFLQTSGVLCWPQTECSIHTQTKKLICLLVWLRLQSSSIYINGRTLLGVEQQAAFSILTFVVFAG